MLTVWVVSHTTTMPSLFRLITPSYTDHIWRLHTTDHHAASLYPLSASSSSERVYVVTIGLQYNQSKTHRSATAHFPLVSLWPLFKTNHLLLSQGTLHGTSPQQIFLGKAREAKHNCIPVTLSLSSNSSLSSSEVTTVRLK